MCMVPLQVVFVDELKGVGVKFVALGVKDLRRRQRQLELARGQCEQLGHRRGQLGINTAGGTDSTQRDARRHNYQDT